MLEALETALTIVGAISIVIGVIRFIWAFFSNSSVRLDDVKIHVENYDECDDYSEYFACQGLSIYPYVYKNYDGYEGEEITANFFIPNNTIIKKLKIKKVTYTDIVTGREKYKTVERINQITPEQPLCVVVPRCEAIPQFKLEWKTKYGGKTTYYFYSSLRDGTYSKPGFEYSFGAFAKLRKFFGLE